jgi:hypothetical protein
MPYLWDCVLDVLDLLLVWEVLNKNEAVGLTCLARLAYVL